MGEHECPTCDRSFDTKRGRSVHHKKAHGESISSRPADERGATEDGDYTCPECGKSYTTKNGMKTHYGRSHEGTIAGVETECEQCGKSFRAPEYSALLNRHTAVELRDTAVLSLIFGPESS